MPRPTNIREIVTPAASETTELTDPFFDGWAEQYGRHPWWRVYGFRFAAVRADVSVRQIASAQTRKRALEVIQGLPGWQDFYRLPKGLNDSTGGWDSMGEKPIFHLFNGLPPQKQGPNSERSDAVPFAKAALAILCLEIAAGDRVDIYKWVRICPAVYRVSGFNNEFWAGISKSNRSSASEACAVAGGQSCLNELASHPVRPVTYQTAKCIADHFREDNLIGGVEFEHRVGSITASRKPNRFERVRTLPKLSA